VRGEHNPTLPRYGTDSLATASRDAAMDPTLPRYGTDSLATASRVAAMDPTLPRDGTDFIPLQFALTSAIAG